jgi:hypothetical protein
MSQTSPFQWLLLLLLGLFAGVGCGGTNSPAPSNPTAEEPSAEEPGPSNVHKSYAVSDLPDPGEKLTPLDQGRVVVTLPMGWKTLQRKPTYLVACVPEENRATQLPRIVVSVSDPPADLSSSTSASNAAEHAKGLQAAAEKEKKKLIEPCKALGLGDNTWIRYVRSAKQASGDFAAIQSLQAVRSGRLYTVELTVSAKDNPKSSKPPIIYQKSLADHRDFAYAVAAHMTFPKDGSGEMKPAEVPPAENVPDEKAPAEKAPAEKAKPEPAP